MTSEQVLPAGFAALEPFVEGWALEGSAARVLRRLDSAEADRAAFYEAAKGLAPAALAQLDSKPLGDLDAGERRLMSLMLSLAHVALAVEQQGEGEAHHADGVRHFTITRTPAGA
jgi:hypothetical protein